MDLLGPAPCRDHTHGRVRTAAGIEAVYARVDYPEDQQEAGYAADHYADYRAGWEGIGDVWVGGRQGDDGLPFEELESCGGWNRGCW